MLVPSLRLKAGTAQLDAILAVKAAFTTQEAPLNDFLFSFSYSENL
jgi:hypothetical protein